MDGLINRLRKNDFEGFPHTIDERKQALDAEFSERADWPGRMTQLRQLFRKRTSSEWLASSWPGSFSRANCRAIGGRRNLAD
jgi:hypothetical protein